MGEILAFLARPGYIYLFGENKEFDNLKIFGFSTLESGIDVGQGITVGPGKFVRKNKRRALNKHRA